ncbi:MAG: hypothetical protein J6B04_05765 [Clostridia bacterium]|nr:hypothetical protein [Clostridia bacterium]
MFTQDIIQIIKNYEVKGSRYGLQSTRNLLNALGSPDDHLKIIHIAGTNGKGSTAEYLTQILTAAGEKVGTFTSPEVYSYLEKFKINGQPLSEDKLKKYLEQSYYKSTEFEIKPTAFEVETAAALLAFYKEGCTYCVLECGLGGLSDSTNAINKKELAIITSIGLEHTALLGDTLTKICEQKSGIIKNCPCVVSAFQYEETLNYFKEKNAIIADEPIEKLSGNALAQTFLYGGEEYKINMLGTPQLYNAATAIKAAVLLNIPKIAIKTGLKNAKLLGRVEVINNAKTGVTYILDGSHNPDSFTPLCNLLKELNNFNSCLIFGCLSDKNVEKSAKILGDYFNLAYAVSPQSYRAMDEDEIYLSLKKYIKRVNKKTSVEQALSSTCNKLVVVCGTFTILKEAKEWIEKRL